MPYQQRQIGGLVPMPAPPDALQSLSSIMQLGSQMEGYQAARKERQQNERIENAFRTAQGDPTRAAEILAEQGDFVSATQMRERAAAINERKANERRQAVDQLGQRLDQHKTLFGQGAQMLREIETQPHLYPDVRPRLVELAASIDPQLAQGIPETYEPTQIRQMLEFAEATAVMSESRARAAAAAKAKLAAKRDLVNDMEADTKIVSDWFSVSPNQADWDHSIEAARAIGVSDDVLAKVGPTWSTESREAARQLGLTPAQRAPKEPEQPTSIQAALLDPNITPQRKAELLALQKQLSDAQRAPGDRQAASPESAQAILNNPSIWGEITPSLRDQLLVPLARAGFDFGAAAKSLSNTQKGQIERWHTDEISRLNRDRRDPVLGMSDEEYAVEKRRIDESYRVQLGASAPALAENPRQPTAPPPAATRGMLPQSEMGAPPPASPSGAVRFKLPDGRVVTFESKEKADAFLRDAGFTVQD